MWLIDNHHSKSVYSIIVIIYFSSSLFSSMTISNRNIPYYNKMFCIYQSFIELTLNCLYFCISQEVLHNEVIR